VANLDNKLIHR